MLLGVDDVDAEGIVLYRERECSQRQHPNQHEQHMVGVKAGRGELPVVAYGEQTTIQFLYHSKCDVIAGL